MQTLALLSLKDGRSTDKLAPLIKREEAYVWRGVRDGIVRQVWNIQGRLAGVALLEVPSVEEANTFLGNMPAVLAGLVEIQIVPLSPFTGFEVLFEADVLAHLNRGSIL